MAEKENTGPAHTHTCSDYRAEMILLSLKRRLAQQDLSDSERRAVKGKIRRMKAEMGMD
ncbi:MAG: hypothetical protein K9J85_01835 [Desulfobacteraceae bacterium]|nr:hypothetical protein [Desulfobacteraceae bacterium]